VQHSFLRYFSVFGTKVIDFNTDSSAFSNLSDLIGKDASQLLKITKD